MDQITPNIPNQPAVCTEQGSIVSTRGIYANDRRHGYISAYDTNWPGWTPPNAQTLWSYVADRPWLSGVFIWAGFDYGGEPTPMSWPDIGSSSISSTGADFRRTLFYYYQSWWQTNPVIAFAAALELAGQGSRTLAWSLTAIASGWNCF